MTAAPGRIDGGASHLVDIQLWRLADGTIAATIGAMAAQLIETTGADVPERVRIIANWTSRGAVDLLRQARHLELTTGPANDG